VRINESGKFIHNIIAPKSNSRYFDHAIVLGVQPGGFHVDGDVRCAHIGNQ